MIGPRRRFARPGPGAAWVLGAALAACGPGAGPEEGQPPPAVTQLQEHGGARLELTLERDSLTTAETVGLRLEVECAESDTVEFPDADSGFGVFSVIRDRQLPARLAADGRLLRGREYELQPFLPGEYEVPALTVRLNGGLEISSEPVQVTVESVLEDPESAELLDIGDAVDVPAPRWWWAGTSLGVAAALAGLAWWLKRRRTRREEPPPVAAHEAALAALEELLAGGLPSGAAMKGFYLALSDIVRRYIEERFGLRAPEQTTEEFLSAMAETPVIRRDHQALLRAFLQQADMVKFAQFQPRRHEAGEAGAAARRFIEQTVPDEMLLGAEGRAAR